MIRPALDPHVACCVLTLLLCSGCYLSHTRPCDLRATGAVSAQSPYSRAEYDAGPWPDRPSAGPIAGSVYYPAHSDSAPRGQYVSSPTPRLAGGQCLHPIVFIAHGRTVAPPTSYRGYEYLQGELARRGIIAVSVRLDVADSEHLGDEAWARRMLASVEYFRGLAGTSDSMYFQAIDFSRMGLMGHSRGGDAVHELVPMLPPGDRVRAVVLLATSGGSTLPRWRNFDGIASLTILPAAEGAGSGYSPIVPWPGAPGYPDLPSATAYDLLDEQPFKAQLYVHHANHNFWNRLWTNRDTPPDDTLVFSRRHHELIFGAYGGAFFNFFLNQWAPSASALQQRAALRSDTGDMSYLNGWAKPTLYRPADPSAGVYGETRVNPADLQLSWASTHSLVVDDFESTGSDRNALGGVITSSGLALVEDSPVADAGGGTRLLVSQLACDPVVSPCTGSLRSELPAAQRDLSDRDSVLIRVAEPISGHDATLPSRAVAFELGLESDGRTVWVHSDTIGGISRPFVRGDRAQRFVLSTLRFPLARFPVARTNVVAIHLRPQTETGRSVVFDDLALE